MPIAGTIVITNDDGYDAPGIHAAYRAVGDLGHRVVVAPRTERSACGHAITLRKPIHVERRIHEEFGEMYIVDGTPADCVRLAYAELINGPIGMVVSGINRGANAGVDLYYSGTVAGAREGAILRLPAVAISQAVRHEAAVDWTVTHQVAGLVLRSLLLEAAPAPGFWNINLPAPIPPEPMKHVHRTCVANHAMPMKFERKALNPDHEWEFGYGASYWVREEVGPSDYTVLRDGGIAVSAVMLDARC